LEAQRSPEALARFGVPAGGCGDWLRVPVAVRVDFDGADKVEKANYVVLPYHDKRFIDKVRRWLRL
jgi:hypothetical protein